ncbi:DUF1223 domain-containing protein [Yoonia sp.]|uniref:DUF1223 domain-containing protein n=1 Tax=Yoonia sp. TaxID=2212373 RepID=UPI002FD941CB
MRAILATLSFLVLMQAPSAFAQNGPVVVELYTSQGCASCPPADEILLDLADREDVIALALHVDYWDYIGWKDIFGRPEYTQRQHAYARAAQVTTVYTPQMVLNGQDQVVGSRGMKVAEAIEAHRARGQIFDVRLIRSGGQVTIRAAAGPAGEYVVQLVRFLPRATVEIKRGENAGRTLTYANIVTAWDVLGSWDGRTALNTVATVSGDDAVAVLIQHAGYGPIVGAAQMR